MNNKVFLISWLLYALNEQTKAKHVISQKETNVLSTLQLHEDATTLDPVNTREVLNNKLELETGTNHQITSSRIIDVEPNNSNGGIQNYELTDSEDVTKDLAKTKQLENATEEKKKETYTHSIPNFTPINLSEDQLNSSTDETNIDLINSGKDPNFSEDLKPSDEDRTSSNLVNSNQSSASKEPSSSKLNPSDSSEDLDPAISKDPGTSSKHPSTSNLDPKDKLETSNEETKLKGPKPDQPLLPPANIMFPSAPTPKPPDPKNSRCLTGYMTDVQAWVDANGNLTRNVDVVRKIDLSSTKNPVKELSRRIQSDIKRSIQEVTYLSMARCNLKAVPQIFNLKNANGESLHSMVEYLTFFGNDFATISNAGEYFDENLNATGAIVVSQPSIQWSGDAAWAAGFTSATLSKLKELDLRKCSIQQLTDNIFAHMPKLQALYLGENCIKTISADAFAGLQNLRHLDMSRNFAGINNEILIFQNEQVFKPLKSLVSLDLSFTAIQQRDVAIFQQLGRNLQSLSICYSGLNSLPGKVFAKTQLRYLDVSGNGGIFGNANFLAELQTSLEVIYAKDVDLKGLEAFKYFEKLQILDVDFNEVVAITRPIAKSLKNLKALILDNNRFVTWWENDVFSSMSRLQFLSLRDNNINFISNAMIDDLKYVDYIGLSMNFIVCNCYAREVFEIAYRNQNRKALLQVSNTTSFNRGYQDVNELIKNRNEIPRVCDGDEEFCEVNEVIESEGNFTLFDYDTNLYSCLSVPEAVSVPYSNTSTCIDSQRASDYYEDLIGHSKARLMFLLIIPVLIFPVLIFLYVFRRNLRYFWITMKNSATLSLINSEKTVDEDTIFHYDVFVSYCNGDRDWVLDYLLPYVEKDCNVSVCLHERDFQVGLSILENIVSCMDRSRCIMLIISKQFLESQWCQFEMHLAQHRLLETRREDLILVLLEDIPRRMRPTTLHYLMLTKTYILWPMKETEHTSFWKRLTRSLIARSRLVKENVSLA